MSEKTKPVENAKPERVRVKIPITRTEKGDVYISVNEETFLIRRGEWVEVPRYVADQLAWGEFAEELAIAYLEKSTLKD